MNLIPESFGRLFPERQNHYDFKLQYNRKLSRFNANIRKSRDTIAVHLNLEWKKVDDEITIGLIQSLLLRILKEKKHTPNIELYNNFIKNIPSFTEKTQSHPVLEASFSRVNQRFFADSVEKPNLMWGEASRRKLASYNFHDDTIKISSLFQHAAAEVLDYLMYHEMLHKQHTFTHRNGRSRFHSREFRQDEQAYPEQEKMEKEISVLLRNSSRRRFWHW